MPRKAIVALAVWIAATVMAALLPQTAKADDPVLLALQAIQPEKRAAIDALRRGDRERAALALSRVGHFWTREIAQVPLVRLWIEPELDRSRRRFEHDLSVAEALVVLGDLSGAVDRIEQFAADFDMWRAARRVRLLADCLDDFARIWEGLLDRTAPADRLAATALSAQAALDRCESESGRSRDAAFREVIDRFRASLSQTHRSLFHQDASGYEKAIREQQWLERALSLR